MRILSCRDRLLFVALLALNSGEPAGAGSNAPAGAALDRARERFESVGSFTCTFSETFTPHGSYTTDEKGRRVSMGRQREGTLAVKWPGRIRFEVDHRPADGPRRQVITICDGATVWRSDREADARPESRTVVVRDRMLPIGSLQDPERAEATLSGELPRGYDIAADVPFFVLQPLGFVDAARITCDGESVIDGEPVIRFSVAADKTTPASIHWIGRNDGIPRRIDRFCSLGTVIELSVRLTDVIVGPDLPPGHFTLQEQESMTILDMDQLRADWGPLDP